MRPARRSDLAPRVEMTPLIDVIFLLLTFFIYSLVIMVRAQVLPVSLSPVTTGRQAEPGTIAAVTIDRAGQLYLNREPIAQAELETRLAEYAATDAPPRLFVAMEQPTDDRLRDAPATPVDRGPVLISLIQRIREAGLTNFEIVGEPTPERQP